jgi:zinc transport system permease protein
MFWLEIFQSDFMTRAVVVGFFTAICTAMLGNFVVTARQAVVSDMLAHTALVGVGIGIYWHLSPTYFALIATVVSAILLWWLSRHKHQAPEAISMLLLTGGLATALLLVHLNKDNPISLDAYLFGSILTITHAEMWVFIVVSTLITAGLLYFWKPLLTLVFDKDFLETQRRSIFYEVFFILLIALTVGISLKVIGGLLIGALIVIPVLIAQSFAKSFHQNVIISVLVNLLAVTGGIFTSFYADVPTSSAIVLILIVFYVVSRLRLVRN